MILITQEELGDERSYITGVTFDGKEWTFPYGELSEEVFFTCLKQVARHNDLLF